jgi:hypothetical protein
MFKDHWLAGVGPGNYGHYYQKYKLPEAEEEVTSPHNFVVQGFTQFGVIGGIGFLLLPAGIFYEVARRSREKSWSEAGEASEKGPFATMLMMGLWVGIFGVLFVFNQSGQPSVMGLLAEYLWFMLIFPAAFVLGSIRGDQLDDMDNSPTGQWEVLCLAGAMAAFIVGDVVNFSLEEPPTQFLFFFIAGLAMAGSEEKGKGKSAKKEEKGKVLSAECLVLSAKNEEKTVRHDAPCKEEKMVGKAHPTAERSKGKIILAAVGIGAYVYFLMVPGIRGENAAMAKYGAEKTFAELARQYPYDGHLAEKAGEAKMENVQNVVDVEEALGWFEEAAKRVKANGQFYSKIGQTEVMLANMEPAEREKHYRAAEEAMEEARACSPRSKTLAMSLGLLYERHFENGGDKSLAEKARRNLEEAMALDAALPVKSLRHFSEEQKAEIKRALGKVRRNEN